MKTRLLTGLGCLLASLVHAQAQPDTADLKRGYSLFRPTPKALQRAFQPDRPGVTESPFTVDAGHFQVEADLFRLVNEREDHEHVRTLDFSDVMFKVGLTNRTDLQVRLPLYDVSREWRDDTPGETRHRGFGDVTIRLKQNLHGNDKPHDATLAAVGYVRLATGGRLGHGGTEYGLLLPFDYELTKSWDVGAQLWGEWEYERDDYSHPFILSPSAQVQYKFPKVLELLVEGIARWDTQQNQWHESLNVAPIFNVGENLRFDLGARVSLNRQQQDEFYSGVAVRW